MALATVLVLLSGIFVHYAKAVHDMPFQHNHYVAGLLVSVSDSSEALASLKL